MKLQEAGEVNWQLERVSSECPDYCRREMRDFCGERAGIKRRTSLFKNQRVS
jgi:hypothetical protein